MCANLELYNRLRTVPEAAKKPIGAGRLKGKTDINPMWRIKMLTQEFGVCGFGWKTTVERAWLETGANGEQTANVQINLYVRDKDTKEWSDAIVGIGGAAFVANEKSGPFTDDDCYKKAYTDAISIACKALGMAADVYYEKDPDSKYACENGDRNILPFPEVAKPLTYAESLEYKVTIGPHKGKTLREIYKTNRGAISEIFNNPLVEARCREAINVIQAEIARANS